MSLTKRIPEVLGLVAALVLAGGCETLNVKNPNAPDSPRLLTDPATVQSLAIGAMRTWFATGHGSDPVNGPDPYPGPLLIVMARSHTAMWNNFNIRFYTGCTEGAWDGYTAPLGTCGPQTEGPYYPRIEWQNDPASAQRTQIEYLWYGYYSALSSANDVLKAIRQNNVDPPGGKTMVEAMAVLVQALCLSEIALNYDQGFIVDWNTDLFGLKFSTPAQMRDAALAKFDEAIALAATTFDVPGDFFGNPGPSYDNVKIAKIANTMAARTLAYFPRSAAENADISAGGLVDWAKVESYAKNGMSSGAGPFDWLFHQDGCINWCDFLKVWSNDMVVMRIHTRVAHLMDPATQPDPWDLAANAKPNSPDKRLGDGTFRLERGTAAYATGVLKADPDLSPPPGKGGYDYVWSHSQEFGNKTRGSWHQSAIGQVRYDSLATCGDNPEGLFTGVGDAPTVLAAENDLLWAEALLRKPSPDPAGAATLINFTRVGPDRLGRPRGGLAPAAGTLQELLYEQDVELPGSNTAPYFNQRRIDNLEPRTPHQMPVPAQELGVLQLGLYTCGGAKNPDGSCEAHPAATPPLANVQRMWAEIEHQALMRVRSGLGAPRR